MQNDRKRGASVLDAFSCLQDALADHERDQPPSEQDMVELNGELVPRSQFVGHMAAQYDDAAKRKDKKQALEKVTSPVRDAEQEEEQEMTPTEPATQEEEKSASDNEKESEGAPCPAPAAEAE